MNFTVDGRQAFAYTAAHALDPAKPTVVFAHGAGLDHSCFGLQSRYFGYHGRNALALDFPGHGRSAGPPLATIPEMADWVLRLLDAAKLEKASVVGHSMGALVALECAARHPQRIARIALLGIAYPMKVSAAFLDAAQENRQEAYDMETIWGHAPQVPLGGN
ncbi:MAG: alpha/beta fold hydrolase, partial [Betaproteobacteria bacterium]|nr:alpha/beta fold hydrolase [Betaproteobacteria bacterium]